MMREKNKLLFISAFPLCNRTAGQNYSLNLARELSEWFNITLFTFNFPGHENQLQGRIIKLNKIRKLISFLSVPIIYPLFVVRMSFKIIIHLIYYQSLYNVIYFDFSQVLIYSLLTKRHPNTFFMDHDIIYQKMRRKRGLLTNLRKKWVYLTEYFLLKQVKNVMVFSVKDQRILKKLYGVKSNVVDFYIDKQIYKTELEYFDLNTFAFYGAWNRNENWKGLEWFLKKYGKSKKINYKIIGGGLSKEKKIFLNEYKNTIVCGFVDNPYDIISKTSALIAPIFQGAGVKVKVIEALSCGVPVIGTWMAFEGIPNIFAKFCFVVRNKDDYFLAMQQVQNISLKERIEFKSFVLSHYPNHKFIDLISNIHV